MFFPAFEGQTEAENRADRDECVKTLLNRREKNELLEWEKQMLLVCANTKEIEEDIIEAVRRDLWAQRRCKRKTRQQA